MAEFECVPDIREPSEILDGLNESEFEENIKASITENIDNLNFSSQEIEFPKEMQDDIKSNLTDNIGTQLEKLGDSDININKKQTFQEVYDNPENMEHLQGEVSRELNEATEGDIQNATDDQIKEATDKVSNGIEDKLNETYKNDISEISKSEFKDNPEATQEQNTAARDATGDMGKQVADNSEEIEKNAKGENKDFMEKELTSEEIEQVGQDIDKEIENAKDDPKAKELAEAKKATWKKILEWGGKVFSWASRNMMLLALLATVFCGQSKKFCGIGPLLENIAKKCGKAGANMIDAASKIVDNFLKPVGGALGSLFKKIFKPLIIIICIIIFFVLLYLFFRYLFPIFLRKKQKKKQQKRK